MVSYQEIAEARAHWLPSLNLSMYGGSQQRYLPNPRFDSSYGENEQALTFDQLIYDFGKTGAELDTAHTAYRKSIVNFDGTVQDVLLDGITAYLEIYRAYHTLLYAKHYNKNVRQQVKMEVERKKRGSGYETDVLEAQAQLSGAEARVARAQGEMGSAKNFFMRTFRVAAQNIPQMGLPNGSKDLLPKKLDQAIHQALTHNSTIRSLEYDIKIARERIQEKKAKFLPRISVNAQGERKYNVSGLRGRKLEYTERAVMDYPLFSGLGDIAAYRASKYQLEAATQRLDNQRLMLRQKVQDDWVHLLSARLEYENTAQQTRELDRFLKLATKERQLGRRTLLEVLVADSNYINAADTSVLAKVELYLARYHLIRDMNILTLRRLGETKLTMRHKPHHGSYQRRHIDPHHIYPTIRPETRN